MDTKTEILIVENGRGDFHRRKRRKLSHSSIRFSKSSKVSVVRRFLEVVPILVDDIRASLELGDLDLELSRFSRWSSTLRHPLPYMVATSIGFFEGLDRAELVPSLLIDPELSNDLAGGRMLGLLLKDRAAECPLLEQQLTCALNGLSYNG